MAEIYCSTCSLRERPSGNQAQLFSKWCSRYPNLLKKCWPKNRALIPWKWLASSTLDSITISMFGAAINLAQFFHALNSIKKGFANETKKEMWGEQSSPQISKCTSSWHPTKSCCFTSLPRPIEVSPNWLLGPPSTLLKRWSKAWTFLTKWRSKCASLILTAHHGS